MERSKWRIAGEVAVVMFTALAAIGALGIWLLPNWDPFGVKEGHFEEMPQSPDDQASMVDGLPGLTLVANSQDKSVYVPYGNGLPTAIDFPNKGGSPCLIQRVKFVPKKRLKTPERVDLSGMVEALPVNFRARHYDRKRKAFMINFQRPHVTSANDWVSLQVAIVERKWVGNTYIGTLTVIYNGNKSISIDGVELDVMDEVPIMNDR
jgi:hypothetical protein